MPLLPKKLSIHNYNYLLPQDRIAFKPLQNREEAKLLIYKNQVISDSLISKLPEHLPPGSLMIFNNTKVIHARLLFKQSSGSVIEIFCLEPADAVNGYENILQSTHPVTWKCFVGNAAKWKTNTISSVIHTTSEEITLTATLKSREKGYFLVSFSWSSNHCSFGEVLHAAGNVPLPPYIKRTPVSFDEERYQTVFAENKGSVAAPTAGLHFSHSLMKQIKNNDIDIDMITLHVGAGTFKPVSATLMEDHEMHAEWMDVSCESIRQLLNHSFIITVGTTSLRTIESLYWMGVKASLGYEDLTLTQWEVYEDHLQQSQLSKQEALIHLLKWMKERKLTQLYKQTSILIAPGYHFKIANVLLTNFHQPKSTLLLLVAAAIGPEWKTLYQHALTHQYRFLSYGDANLLFLSQG